jgi:hypothetical protein
MMSCPGLDRHGRIVQNAAGTSGSSELNSSTATKQSVLDGPADETLRRFAPGGRWGSAVVLLALWFFIAGGSLVASDPDGTATLENLDFFEKSVRPLLLNVCGECHGEKKQWGELRLDSRSAIVKGGESGAAIVPGDPDQSLLIAAVRHEDGLEMPPDGKLTAEQIGDLERWIREGARWPDEPNGPVEPALAARSHWAFQPIGNPAPPDLEDAWCRTPIDRFILEKLTEQGLRPAPVADRRSLIRRLSYDLTGLPPTPEEVEAFVRDDDPDAYSRLVDRLLASPHYGEQWGRHWLDVARYSDTKGYVYAREERFLVQAPAYRDWVVRAFQEDLPYDRFLLLQIAADQVAPEAPEELAAMGFLTVGRRFLGVTHDIIDDRIDVVTRGTMGLSVSCARCHDHKYDPIPTADYYALYGVFQNCTERLVQIGEPAERTDEYVTFEEELHKRQRALEEKLAESRTEAADRVRARITEYLLAQLELEKYPEESFGQILSPDDLIPAFVRRWQQFLSDAQERDDPVFKAWHRFASIGGLDDPLSGRPDGTPGGGSPSFPEDNARAVCQELAREAEKGTVHPLVVERFASPPESMREVAERYGELFTEIDRQWRETLASASTTGATPLPTGLDDPDAEALRQVLYGPHSPCRVPEEAIVTTEYYFDTRRTEALWKLQGEVDRWLINSPLAPPFAVAVVDRETLIEPRVFRRGNPATRGETVPRRFLSLLSEQPPFAHGSGRRELVEAIVDPDNPLTARVWVNRVWQHHFGAGLVSTPSDFGLRAAAPSHPELLDWLARWFMQQGWRTKDLHRLIVHSTVYRQQSARPESDETVSRAAELDPENRLLWRMNPRRLSFEEFRDTLLAVSGDLDRSIGGRATDLFAATHRRRTLYGLIDRQFLPGVLRVFDFANPDLHIPQRSETTVPQQALFAMNHPFMAERARTLVSRLPETNSEKVRVDELYRLAYQRAPTPLQRQAALEFLSAAEESPLPVDPPETRDWQYGYAAIDPEAGTLGEFRPLPHFTGAAWQGGPDWPDGQLGWVQLTAEGGHPGNDLNHAAVRRWRAPRAGTFRIRSTVTHEPAVGDGIRCWIISSRQGVLKQAAVHQRQEPFHLDSIDVQAGETIDFVVDILENLNSDQYLWTPVIELVSAEEETAATTWDARRDFRGPPVSRLTPWEQLAQVLLSANELMFVD